jgi:GDP-L-fucose synthase
MKKILITGGQGYIARNLRPLFENGEYEVVAPARTEMDLLNKEMTLEYFLKEKPDILIHAAARGGKRTKQDDWDTVFMENTKMWDTIEQIGLHSDVRLDKIFVFGSGAEFDRRLPIEEICENQVKSRYPSDPYGLSKNLITRRALESFTMTYVLRLFGCFNWDDDPTRFIKASILNLKRGLPIDIHQEKMMDYFYLDDIYTVIDYIIQHKHCPRDINLVYKDKMSLLNIASLIHKHMGKFEPTIKLGEMDIGNPYTGNGYFIRRMEMLDENFKLIGLEEGIRRTVLKLT